MAHRALRELAGELAMAHSTEDIGRALLHVANRFRLNQVLTLDITKLFDRVGPAIIFSTQKQAGRRGVRPPLPVRPSSLY